MSDTRERYPRCVAALEALLGSSTAAATSTPPSPFRVGPGVLRPPPVVARQATPDASSTTTSPLSSASTPETGALLGELVDMVLVGADDAASGRPEVRLQFKSDIFGGLHMRLVKSDDGLHAHFVVKDAATRRVVVDHVDALVAHLRSRGFSVIDARLEIA